MGEATFCSNAAINATLICMEFNFVKSVHCNSYLYHSIRFYVVKENQALIYLFLVFSSFIQDQQTHHPKGK